MHTKMLRDAIEIDEVANSRPKQLFNLTKIFSM